MLTIAELTYHGISHNLSLKDNMNNRREFIKTFLAGGVVLAGSGLLSGHVAAGGVNPLLQSNSAAGDAWAQVPEILQRIKPPVTRWHSPRQLA